MRADHTRPPRSGRPSSLDSPADQRHAAVAAELYEILHASPGMTRSQLRTQVAHAAPAVDAAWTLLTEWGVVRQDEVTGECYTIDWETALAASTSRQQEIARQLSDAAQNALETARAIQRQIRPAAQRARAALSVQEYDNRDIRDGALRDRLGAVSHSSDSMHPGVPDDMSVLQTSLKDDAASILRGVAVRAIYPRFMLDNPPHRRYLHDLAAVKVDVRLLDHIPYDLLIFDRHTGILPGAPGDASSSMTVITGYVGATFLVSVYEDCWRRAIPLPQATLPGQLEELDLHIVRMMLKGLSDDQIAHALGYKTRRTIQRRIANLMDELGVTSRTGLGFVLGREAPRSDLP